MAPLQVCIFNPVTKLVDIVSAVSTFSGSPADAGAPVVLNANGELDSTFTGNPIAALAAVPLTAGNLVNLYYTTINGVAGVYARLANASHSVNLPAHGYVVATVAAGASVSIYTQGLMTISFTSGYSTADVGTAIYTSNTTPGFVTKTSPTPPDLIQPLGYIYTVGVNYIQIQFIPTPYLSSTISVGTVTALPTGNTPTVTNSGTPYAAVFNFGLPTGATGITGAAGSTSAITSLAPSIFSASNLLNRNLYDQAGDTPGYEINSTGGLTANGNCNASNYVYCQGALSFVSNMPIGAGIVPNFGYVCLYDANGVFMSVLSIPTASTANDQIIGLTSVALPGTQTYIRFSYVPSHFGGGYQWAATAATAMVVGSATSTATILSSYQPFGLAYSSQVASTALSVATSVSQLLVKNVMVSPTGLNCNAFDPLKALNNTHVTTAGAFVADTGGLASALVYCPNATLFVTDIPMRTEGFGICTYDAEGNFIANIASTFTGSNLHNGLVSGNASGTLLLGSTQLALPGNQTYISFCWADGNFQTPQRLTTVYFGASRQNAVFVAGTAANPPVYSTVPFSGFQSTVVKTASQLGCVSNCPDLLQIGSFGYQFGTDNTAIINAFLATASATNPIKLILDGQYLTSGLVISPAGYTTIEGLNRGCGIFQALGAYTDGIRIGAYTANVGVSEGFRQLFTPAAPTGVVSATGGTLSASSYVVSIVAVDASGNTTTASATATFTNTGTTGSIALSWAISPRATIYRIYLPTGQYFTSTTNSFTLTSDTGTAGTAPTTNTTVVTVNPRTAAYITLRNFTINGNAYNNVAQTPANQPVAGAVSHSIFPTILADCHNVILEDMNYINATWFSLGISNANDIAIRGCNFTTTGTTHDGIHVFGLCEDIVISDCGISTGDDGIALNAPEGYAGEISRVAITNCRFLNSHSLVRLYNSAQTLAAPNSLFFPIRNVVISNCTGTFTTQAIDLGITDGGLLATYPADQIRDLTVSNCSFAGPLGLCTILTPVGSITFRGIRFTPTGEAPLVNILFSSVGDVVLDDVAIVRNPDGNTLMDSFVSVYTGVAVDRLSLINCRVIDEEGSAYTPITNLVAITGGASVQRLRLEAIGLQHITSLGTNLNLVSAITGSGVLGTGTNIPDANMDNNVMYLSATSPNVGKPCIKLAGTVYPFTI